MAAKAANDLHMLLNLILPAPQLDLEIGELLYIL